MSKLAAGLFVKGLITLFVGILIFSLGLPDETDVQIQAGNAVLDALNNTANNPNVSQVVDSGKQAFLMFGGLASLIGIVELIGSALVLVKSASRAF